MPARYRIDLTENEWTVLAMALQAIESNTAGCLNHLSSRDAAPLARVREKLTRSYVEKQQRTSA